MEAESKIRWGLQPRKVGDPASLKRQGSGFPGASRRDAAWPTHFGLPAPELSAKKLCFKPAGLLGQLQEMDGGRSRRGRGRRIGVERGRGGGRPDNPGPRASHSPSQPGFSL